MWSCNSHSLWHHDLWPWFPDDSASDPWSWKHILEITEDQNRSIQKLQGSISSPTLLLFKQCQEVNKPRSSLTITTKGQHSNKIGNLCIRRPQNWFIHIYEHTDLHQWSFSCLVMNLLSDIHTFGHYPYTPFWTRHLNNTLATLEKPTPGLLPTMQAYLFPTAGCRCGSALQIFMCTAEVESLFVPLSTILNTVKADY